MIHARNNRVVKDRDARADGLGWVVEKRLQVGVRTETESSYSLVSPVDDKECTIGKRCADVSVQRTVIIF